MYVIAFASSATENGRRRIRSSKVGLLEQGQRHREGDPDDETDDRNPPVAHELIAKGDGNADHHDHDGGSEPACCFPSHDTPCAVVEGGVEALIRWRLGGLRINNVEWPLVSVPNPPNN